MTDCINDEAWELWEFEAFGAAGTPAVGVSLYRDSRGLEQGGFHAELNAIWEDGSKWGETLHFPLSVVTADGDAAGEGRVTGTWAWKGTGEGKEAEGSITFTIDSHLSSAELRFNVPGKVSGEMQLQRLPGSNSPNQANLATSEHCASLYPSVYYLFPMGPVQATASLTFPRFDRSDDEQKLSIGFDQYGPGRGGMVRGWSALSWPLFMNDAYYTVAHVGPYTLQLLRVLGSAAAKHLPYAVARLHHGDELVCAANDAVDDSSQQGAQDHDTVRVDKIFLRDGQDQSGSIFGAFRDKNIGYVIEFKSPRRQQRWVFEARHRLPLWSEPTSAPGPDACGKSGWVEVVSGGLENETFQGSGVSGQLQIPVP
ncbi:hypothetical protein CCM_06470 [Cordyceps militaris CM01]|uniref:Uncharacterized protein n=1 Tax=Cordyceps militaris (strain CM01) TaxID=983644 RepID=G3JML4_CORMM|nr:uncharacterized protein CCM_06470 [Cordyceps militaris CM01]EGX90050.1 hypothetical protein CCM_06470 [Cordyceps militaris CM01]